MQPVRHYRVWIYSINALIILFQSILCIALYHIFYHQWWVFVPLKQSSAAVIALEMQMSVQYFACICGFLGVYFSKRSFIKIYWLFMVPLMAIDVFMAVTFLMQLRNVHREFIDHLNYVVDQQVAEGIRSCFVWERMVEVYNCCAPPTIQDMCAQGVTAINETVSSCSVNFKHCNADILRWMHTKTDLVGIIVYFILFPLKFVVVMVLREDIEELFSEIVYSDHVKLHKHWEDEEDDQDSDLQNTPTEQCLFGA